MTLTLLSPHSVQQLMCVLYMYTVNMYTVTVVHTHIHNNIYATSMYALYLFLGLYSYDNLFQQLQIKGLFQHCIFETHYPGTM